MIKVKNLTKSYDGKLIFENISFEIKKGEHCVFMGTSGTGKTTLLRIIAGLEKADSGEVISDKNVKKTFVFQENRLFNSKSVLENILSIAPDREKALYILKESGLMHDINKKAGKLSGGMKRRLAIARALCFGGDLYFMDEPLRELDSDTNAAILELIKKETAGKTVIMITHDGSSADSFADRIITFSGSPMQIAEDKII